MLKGNDICVCLLLLFCNAIICVQEDASAVSTEKRQPQPRYLKELFPFLREAEQNEDIKPLLTGMKRKRRVCHHGNMKRGSHVVHFKPTSDVRTLRFPNRGISSPSKWTLGKAKRHATLAPYCETLASRNTRQDTQDNKKTTNEKKPKKIAKPQSTTKGSTPKHAKTTTQVSKTTTKLVKSTHSSPSQHMNKHTSTPKTIRKQTRTASRRSTTRGKHLLGVNKRSQILLETVAKETPTPISHDEKMAMMSSTSLFHPSYLPMMGVITPTVISSSTEENNGEDNEGAMLTTLSGRSLASSTLPSSFTDSLERSASMDTDLEIEKREKELTKRESPVTKSKLKKNIKSVITKILIIPVERQIEEAGEEVPEEIDVVSFKHSREGKKKHSTKHHKTSTTALASSSTASPGSFSSTEDECESETTCAYEEDTTTCVTTELAITESKTRSTTTCATTAESKSAKSSHQTTHPTGQATKKKSSSSQAFTKPTSGSTDGSTMLSLSITVSLAKECDGNSTYSVSTTPDEKKHESPSTECAA